MYSIIYEYVSLFQVKCEKCHLDQHQKTSVHIQKNCKSTTSIQPFILQVDYSEQKEFSADLYRALVSANIPWQKLDNPTVRDFLKKYTKHSIPDQSTLRKYYMHPQYHSVSLCKILTIFLL